MSTAELLKTDNPGLSVDEAQKQAGEMAANFGIVQFCGILLAPLNGAMIDASKLTIFKFITPTRRT